MRVHEWMNSWCFRRTNDFGVTINIINPQSASSFDLNCDSKFRSQFLCKWQNILPQWLTTCYDQKLVRFTTQQRSNSINDALNGKLGVGVTIKISITKRAS